MKHKLSIFINSYNPIHFQCAKCLFTGYLYGGEILGNSIDGKYGIIAKYNKYTNSCTISDKEYQLRELLK